MKNKNFLIVGYGSIGKRHYNNLISLGGVVSVISSRIHEGVMTFKNLEGFFENHECEVVIICNETSEHLKTFEKLQVFKNKWRKLVIEKPIFSDLPNALVNPANCFVAYNYRFHNLFNQLVDIVSGKKILSSLMYVGQYLPDWRPGRDYRNIYSSMKDKGGGVLRDLSHEIDMLYAISSSDLKVISSHGGHFSHLATDTEDVFSLTLSSSNICNAVISINCIDRIKQRFWILSTDDESIKIDFVSNTIQVNDKLVQCTDDYNHSYLNMAENMINDDFLKMATANEGLDVLRIITSAEQGCKNEKI